MERYWESSSGFDDPRTGNALRHDLLEMLFMAPCGSTLCVDMAHFAEASRHPSSTRTHIMLTGPPDRAKWRNRMGSQIGTRHAT